MRRRWTATLCACLVWLSSAYAIAQEPNAADGGTPSASNVEAEQALRARATLLAVHLEDMQRRSDLSWRIGFNSVLGATEIAIGAGFLVDDIDTRPGFIAGGSVLLAGTAAALFAHETWQAPLLSSATSLGVGALAIGVALSDDDARTVGLAFGAGYTLTGILTLISNAIRPEVPASRLAQDYARLRDPGSRAQLSAHEIAAIEDRYRRAAPAIDWRIIWAPTVIGNAVASVGLLTREHEGSKRTVDSVIAGAALTAGVLLPLLVMSQSVDYELYEEQLEDAGVSLELSPTLGGLGAFGRF